MGVKKEGGGHHKTKKVPGTGTGLRACRLGGGMDVWTSGIRAEANLALGSPSQRSHSWGLGLGLGNQKNLCVRVRACMCACVCVRARARAPRLNAEIQIKASDHTFPSSPDSSHKTILVLAKCRLRKKQVQGFGF